MKTNKVVIISAVRTPFDKFGGLMRDIPSIELGKKALEAVVDRVGLPKDKVEEIYYGTTISAEVGQYLNIPARQALLKAGFPSSTLSLTIDRACCSSMTAFQMAYRQIKYGETSIAIGAGAENLSNVPYIVSGARWGKRLGDLKMVDLMADIGYKGWNPVSVDASEVAVEYGVMREEQDFWAYLSHQRYQTAFECGKFVDEVIPYEITDAKGINTVITADQTPRPDTTTEKLAKLKTVYNTPTVTAGNAPGLNAGASAILLMSEEKAKTLGYEPLAYVDDVASKSDDARYIASVPAAVIKLLLEKTGKTLDDISLIEINEAFAAMPLVSTKILANGDETRLKKLRDMTNVNGGAIAIGHPMGATGARLIMTLMYELRRRGGTGIAAICGGLAQGDAVMLTAAN